MESLSRSQALPLSRHAAGALIITLLFLSGCAAVTGTAASGTRAAAAGLAYGEPDPNPVTYAFSDTASFEIEAPGYGAMEVETAHAGEAELFFASDSAGYRVGVRFPDLNANFRGAGQGAEKVTAADIGGMVEIELSPRGHVTVVDTPAVTATFEAVSGLDGLVRPLFVSLPGGGAPVGSRWVDTVDTRETAAGTVSNGRSIITSTLVGDTLVDGLGLLHITTRTETEVEVTGVSGGVAIEQRLAGTVTGTVLWDIAANRLFERRERGLLTGTLAMPEAGVDPMPITARVRRSVSLLP